MSKSLSEELRDVALEPSARQLDDWADRAVALETELNYLKKIYYDDYDEREETFDRLAAERDASIKEIGNLGKQLGECQAERDKLAAETRDLREALMQRGYYPCSIPACNCGWHKRRTPRDERNEENERLRQWADKLCASDNAQAYWDDETSTGHVADEIRDAIKGSDDDERKAQEEGPPCITHTPGRRYMGRTVDGYECSVCLRCIDDPQTNRFKGLHKLVQKSEQLGLYDPSPAEVIQKDHSEFWRSIEERFPQHTASFNILPLLQRLWAWVRR